MGMRIEILVSGAIYAVFLTGMILAAGWLVRPSIARLVMIRRLSARRRKLEEPAPVMTHLDMIARTTLPFKKSDGRGIIALSLLLMAAVTFAGIKNFGFASALAPGLIAAVLPYILLRMRLETLRTRGSLEGESFIASFLSGYRVSGYNVFEAMEKCALDPKGGICAGLIYDMLVAVRNTADRAEIHRAVSEFSFAVNTNWSRMFCYNAELAVTSGMNVSPAIEDILIQLRDGRAAAEDRKRLNAESSRMVLFLVPVMYIATIFMSDRYVDVPAAEFMRNQFLTPQGFGMLIAMVFMFLINVMLLQLVNNRRLDY